jgi:hypothetical protein
MENSRKNLKFMSIGMLILAALSFVRILLDLIFTDFTQAALDAEGFSQEFVTAGIIIVAVISFILLLPQIYIGIKGLRVAKNPDSSKGHIIWGIILLIITILGLVSPAIAIIKMEDVFTNISSVLSIAVDVVVLYEYVKYAKAVAKGN